MTFFSIANTTLVRFLIVFFISASLLAPLAPTLVLAQGTAPAAPTSQTAQTAPKNGGSCTGWWALMPQCIVRGISTALSMGIIYLAGLVLSVAGSFMNGVLALTTVDFNASVYTYVAPGIEAVLTVFRDIANIIIIGMFTFVAISIILGIKEFGQKKFIAHVLIIAVLINFSLLFTKIVIDASNFTATHSPCVTWSHSCPLTIISRPPLPRRR